jgi:hypothetical protein
MVSVSRLTLPTQCAAAAQGTNPAPNCLLQEIALKLRAEGRTYNPRVLRYKHFTSEGFPARKQVRVKVKASQRNKQPYHVSGLRTANVDIRVPP